MTEIVHRNQNTVHFVDLDKVRKAVTEEKTLRFATLADIERETGVLGISVSNFLNGAGLSMNAVVSLIKWSNKRVDTFVIRRREVATRAESKAEQEQRLLMAFLKNNKITVEDGESPVVAAIRTIGNLNRRNGDA